MAEYPIILIPDAIQQARLAQPPIPSPPNLPIPQYPGDAPKRINKTLIGVETAAVIVPGMAIAKTDGGGLAGILFFLAGFGAITQCLASRDRCSDLATIYYLSEKKAKTPTQDSCLPPE